MKVLIESGIFPDEQDAITKACKALKIDYSTWSSSSFPPYSENDNKVFFYGSILTASKLKKSKYRYQIWLGQEFDYSYFGASLCRDLLNSRFALMPFGAIKYHSKRQEDLDDNDKIFIRSNSGKKLFGGGLFTAKEFIMSNPLMNLDDLLVFAEPKNIGKEYRCIVGGTEEEFGDKNLQIITHSSYGWNDEEYTAMSETNLSKTMEILSRNDIYHPYPMWVMDVVEFENSIKIVECNSINTSGWYGCNVEKIIAELDSLIRTQVI